MTNQSTKSAATEIQSLFNPQGNQDVIKMWASMNERLTEIVVDAGTRSIDILGNTTKEALSNLSEVMQVREEPTDYAKAYSDFAQKQVDLMVRTAQDVGDVTQNAGAETTELASKAGEKLSDKVAASTKDAVDKVGSSVKKSA